jgi:hypothetical protein
MIGLRFACSRAWKRRTAAWVGCAVLFAAPLVAQPSSTLTPKDIHEAIEWGLTGDPSPYLLHHQDGRTGNGVNSVIVGAVYTPFLRVALAAKAARDKREDFTPADVKAAWIEPVVYVAFRWYCCVDRDHGDNPAEWNPSKPPLDYKIAVPGDSVLRVNPGLKGDGLAAVGQSRYFTAGEFRWGSALQRRGAHCRLSGECAVHQSRLRDLPRIVLGNISSGKEHEPAAWPGHAGRSHALAVIVGLFKA